jgi:ribonuclease R
MSGLVPLSLVEDDFFVFDQARRNLVGRRTRRVIRLGDSLTVQVAKVDTFKKQVDFRLVAEILKPSPPRPPAPAPRPPRPGSRPTFQAAPRPGSRPYSPRPQPPGSRPKGDRAKAPPPAQPQANPRRENPENAPRPAVPVLRTSTSQLPSAQRPLLKSSGNRGFGRHRRRRG